MEKLIPIVNKLQDVFNTVGSDSIQLPQIVVVGSQSSGKSSVLENLVGRDFLPRGSGIVTRRPLVLQLINVPFDSTDSDFQEWAEFLHLPDKLFVEFDEIREEIEAETDRVAPNQGISSVPINLKIYSPNVLNLTLVDLPGITKVPVGDQPADIEVQVRNLIKAYIGNPNSIILAVSPANTDLANSESLKLARQVDPQGTRTVGVVTKIDLMDAGTDAMDLLCGRVVPTKLGFIGIVNRSQLDINNKKEISAALKTEAEFFSSHPVYRSISHRCGTAYLAATMNKILMHHIRDCLPQLKSKIMSLLAQTQQTLQALGSPLVDSADKGALLLEIITRFAQSYSNAIEGTSREIATTELFGGARICYIFHEIFGRTLEGVDPLDGLSINDIRTAIRNATGTRPALFVPEISFELLVKRQIKRLEDPSLRCVELVFEELIRIISQCENQEIARFQRLHTRVVNTVTNMLKKRLEPTMSMIENLIAIELAYVNTNHPDFMGGSNAVTQMVEKAKARSTSVSGPSRGRGFSEIQSELESAAASGGNANEQGSSSQSHQQGVGGGKGAGNSGSLGSGAGHSGSNSGGGTVNARLHSASESATSHPSAGIFNYFFGARRTADKNIVHSSAVAAALTPVRPNGGASSIAGDLHFHSPDVMSPAKDALTGREKMETELIQSLIRSYFGIVRKNIMDTVPKTVMHFLVNWVQDSLQSELVSALYKPQLFDELLEESDHIATQRHEAKEMLDVLKKAANVLSELRDVQV